MIALTALNIITAVILIALLGSLVALLNGKFKTGATLAGFGAGGCFAILAVGIKFGTVLNVLWLAGLS